ncbi:Periplasmic protein TonB [Methylacidimicrobium sp. AP8]|uniref:energy transducer TonB n=1 Tax=Methylacidimicrobium sp. AP8 TaxID=2730359 RepID=UPI0018C07894|nr:energy transducer TonB [Methylacidimicrobium sp. AP8]CAB4244466.1 Periplasmic protein TonB [Methylacidimicrobium sp. AP8]
MERNDVLGYLFSLLFHATILFVVGLFFIQRIEYGMQSGAAATEVDLAEPPAPEPAPPPEPLPPPPPPPAPEEMALPAPEAKPTPPPPVTKPRTAPKKASASVGAPAPSSAGKPTQMAVPDYLRNPKPAYPAAERAAGHQGRVILRVHVSADGRPESVSILQSSGYSGLDQAALEAVRHWRFRPARVGPIPIPINADVPVNFVLNKK